MEEKTAISTIQASQQWLPVTIEESLRLLDIGSKYGAILSNSKLVPNHLQGKPDDCALVAMQALRWGMDPLVVAQKTHVVSGLIGYEAQLVNSLVNTLKPTKDSIKYEFIGEWSNVIGNTTEKTNEKGYKYRVLNSTPKDEQGCGVKVWATLKGEDKPRVLELLLTQALTRNSTMWASDPKQQLAYLAVKKWVRLHAPQILLGVYTVDEIEDRQPIDGGEVIPEPVQKKALLPLGEDLPEDGAPETPKDPEPVETELLMTEEDKKALWVLAKEKGAKSKEDVLSFAMTALGYPADSAFNLSEMTAAQFAEVKAFYQEQG